MNLLLQVTNEISDRQLFDLCDIVALFGPTIVTQRTRGGYKASIYITSGEIEKAIKCISEALSDEDFSDLHFPAFTKPTTITNRRALGVISVEVKESEGKTTLTRSPSRFVPVSTSLEVDTPPQQAVAMLNAWANGTVAQDALKDWSVQIREWLITGFEPGSEMNPYLH